VPILAYGDSLGPFEPYDELNINDQDNQSVEESMRVMYEDPGQRDEKKRLMSLFESQNEDGKALCGSGKQPKGVRTRRSTRIAGF
jgi:DNA replication regulator DPB11